MSAEMALPQTKIHELLEDFEGFEQLSEFELQRLKRRVEKLIDELGLVSVLANCMGLVEQELGRLDSAWEWFSQALQMAPSSPLFLCNTVRCLENLGQYSEGLDLLFRSMEDQPELEQHDLVMLTMCKLMARMGLQETAREALAKAIALTPGPSLGSSRARIQLRDLTTTSLLLGEWRTAGDLLWLAHNEGVEHPPALLDWLTSAPTNCAFADEINLVGIALGAKEPQAAMVNAEDEDPGVAVLEQTRSLRAAATRAELGEQDD